MSPVLATTEVARTATAARILALANILLRVEWLINRCEFCERLFDGDDDDDAVACDEL